MKKENVVDKMAKKAFESQAVQRSWQVHVKAFGPILEPAFAEDYRSRIYLTEALNSINREAIKAGLETLEQLKDACVTADDKAAWMFCMGLAFEMAGQKEKMLFYYQKAGEYNHRFYLPYWKVAKSVHGAGAYEKAEENYRRAIDCFEEKDMDLQSQIILASIYANLAACLTLMYRYEEAEAAVKASAALHAQHPGRIGTEAILYAAMGEREKVADCLLELGKLSPEIKEKTAELAESILNGTHAHFARRTD